MTYAPETLRAARSLLLEHLDIHPTGSYPADLDPAEVGIVGDTAHAAKGTSYHLGADQLTSTAYSRRTARDRAGLSNAASAVDVGEFRVTTARGTFTQRDLAKWSVDQCQVNAPDTRDIREIIYSPDGRRVLRYDRERGYASEPREGEADDSHLTHDHYSQYRDAEFRYTLRDHLARWLRHIGLIGDEDDMFTDEDRRELHNLYNGWYAGGPSMGKPVEDDDCLMNASDPKNPMHAIARQYRNNGPSQLAQIRKNQEKILAALTGAGGDGMTPEQLAALGKDVTDRLGALRFVADTDS